MTEDELRRRADDLVHERTAASNRVCASAHELLAALKLLVADVADYEAWQRPCHALDVARAAIASAEGTAA